MFIAIKSIGSTRKYRNLATTKYTLRQAPLDKLETMQGRQDNAGRTVQQLKGLFMTPKQDLYEYYQEQMIVPLEKFEQRRLGIVANLRTMTIILVIIAVLVTAFVIGSCRAVHFGIIPCFVAIALWTVLRKVITSDYCLAFKREVIGGLVKYVDPSLRFSPQDHIAREVYDASMLFNHRPERFNGEDLVTGKVGKTEIAFSELHTEYSVRTKNGRHWHTIFRGLFFQADFNKHFQGFTLVLPDVSQRLLGSFGQKLQEMFAFRGELVKLEDPEFEKMFSVYSSDQIEARYILSPALMQRLKDFATRNKGQVRISFVNSSVFVAITMTKNLFEPRIYTSVMDFSAIQEYYGQLKLAIDIVDDLNLNCRIWTKQ